MPGKKKMEMNTYLSLSLRSNYNGKANTAVHYCNGYKLTPQHKVTTCSFLLKNKLSTLSYCGCALHLKLSYLIAESYCFDLHIDSRIRSLSLSVLSFKTDESQCALLQTR